MLSDILLPSHARPHDAGKAMIQGGSDVLAETDFGSVLAEFALDEEGILTAEAVEVEVESEIETSLEVEELSDEVVEFLSDLTDDLDHDFAAESKVVRGSDSTLLQDLPEKARLLSDTVVPAESASNGTLTQGMVEPEKSNMSPRPEAHADERNREFSRIGLRPEPMPLKSEGRLQSRDVASQLVNAEMADDTVPVKSAPAKILTSQEGAVQFSTARNLEVDTAQETARFVPPTPSSLGDKVESVSRDRSIETQRNSASFKDAPITPDIQPLSFKDEVLHRSTALGSQNFADVPGIRPPDRQDMPVIPLAATPRVPVVEGQAGFALPSAQLDNVASEQAMNQFLEEALPISERSLTGARDVAGMSRAIGIPVNSDSVQGVAVVRQVSEAARLTSGAGIEIALSPEELGSVRLRLSGVDGQMSVVVHADRPETLDLLRRHIDSLSQEFRAIGYGDVAFSFQSGEGGQRGTQGDSTSSVLMVEETSQTLQELDRSIIAMGGGLDIRI